ncbi:N-glycosylase/DNA lyase [Candidatus Margulisiibacteriota bacterium]
MAYNKKAVREIRKTYLPVRSKISSRLREFKDIWKHGSEEDIFSELVFCLLTPQSKAKVCWATVEDLLDGRQLYNAGAGTLSRKLCKVRFRNNKARYIVEARKKFLKNGKISVRSKLGNPRIARDWLVHNIKGMGYKEASHFLRNIGFGENIAILDRHILKNLKFTGVIRKIPASISKKHYFQIENKMKIFAKNIRIPLNHLDLVMWYKEAGEVFK